jgi:hypothetical protein
MSRTGPIRQVQRIDRWMSGPRMTLPTIQHWLHVRPYAHAVLDPHSPGTSQART